TVSGTPPSRASRLPHWAGPRPALPGPPGRDPEALQGDLSQPARPEAAQPVPPLHAPNGGPTQALRSRSALRGQPSGGRRGRARGTPPGTGGGVSCAALARGAGRLQWAGVAGGRVGPLGRDLGLAPVGGAARGLALKAAA